MNWTYNGQIVESAPEGVYGYVYHITDDQGRHYWGKKAFTHRRKTKLSKRAKILPENKRKKIQVKQKDSGWLTYFGSCKPLLEYIKQKGDTVGFTREILYLCKDKQSLSYWEMEVLVKNNVLFRDDCWNGCILNKFYKNKITKV